MNHLHVQAHIDKADAVERRDPYLSNQDGHTVVPIGIHVDGQTLQLVLHSREAAAALAGSAVEALAAWSVSAVEDEVAA